MNPCLGPVGSSVLAYDTMGSGVIPCLWTMHARVIVLAQALRARL